MFAWPEDRAASVGLGRLIRHARAARRIRLEIPGLIGNEVLARRIERTVVARPGVAAVAADVRSGRVLIEYAEGAPIFDQLAALTSPAYDSPPSPADPAPKSAVASGAPPFHALPAGDALRQVGSCGEGLSAQEAAARLRAHGPNEIESSTGPAWYRLLARQMLNLPTGMLLGAAAVSLLLGDILESSAIILVLGLNTAIGYTVEQRSERLLASWRNLEAGTVKVVRGDAVCDVPGSHLVPGDVLICEAGDVLAADGRVLESDRLACDEAPLTGESEPQRKGAGAVPEDAPLAERTSMVYTGTVIVSGRGRVLVTQTGRQTELARVRALIDQSRAPTSPLQARMGELTNRASAVAVAAAGLTTVVGLLRGRSTLSVLRDAVALGVAAIPEGLPLISTATLVNSMARLRAAGVVVRRVSSAEALGGVTVVCADKTGTLTRNKMVLELVDFPSGAVRLENLRANAADALGDPVSIALGGAVLNSEVDLRERHHRLTVIGSSTEQALVEAARRAGIDVAALRAKFPRRVLHERQEGVHYVTSLHDTPDGGRVAFVKGAPEQVVALCDREAGEALSAVAAERVLARNGALASQGLRVLAIAWRRVPADTDSPPDSGYELVALLALRDQLRETAARTVEGARRAGIRTVILTGDQSATAAAIARQLGLDGEVIDGSEVAGLLADGPEAARERLQRVAVFSRVTPSEKLAIVQALRGAGDIVAMAGDGINDAPALKAADVGIAVGRGSTDLARQTADIVLEGEDLASIIAAVGEGRVVQDNLRRAVRFLFATNLSEMAIVVVCSFFGEVPLSALQLLWINLLTDTLPALALAFEPGDPDALTRPPVLDRDSFLTTTAWRAVVRDAALLGATGATGYLSGGPAAAFAVLPAAQLGYAPVCRAPADRPVPDGNRRFRMLIGGSLAVHAAALVVPSLGRVLRLPQRPSGIVLAAAGFCFPWLATRAAALMRRGHAPVLPSTS